MFSASSVLAVSVRKKVATTDRDIPTQEGCLKNAPQARDSSELYRGCRMLRIDDRVKQAKPMDPTMKIITLIWKVIAAY
jgi:hypothetical protein